MSALDPVQERFAAVLNGDGPEREHNTDAGNAARLVTRFGDHIRFVFEHRQ